MYFNKGYLVMIILQLLYLLFGNIGLIFSNPLDRLKTNNLSARLCTLISVFFRGKLRQFTDRISDNPPADFLGFRQDI